ncbi:ABC transporter substrate-binding protein [Candidatus Poriferisodalis sp.]|uniref:ABC transporter substrate-binding protein n=1 Tax=Candidatus Poriferisodalis sp. TaxID=3101277 RepID=UPI003B014180
MKIGLLRRLALGVLAAVFAAAGCSGAPEKSPPPTPVPEPDPVIGFDVGTLRLGVLVDLSGPAARADRAALAGVEAYWDAVNARGGLGGRYEVELTVVDHASMRLDARRGLIEFRDSVAALAYVSDVVEFGVEPYPVVAATATLRDERREGVLTFATPIELTTVALLEQYRTAGLGAIWCVIVDGSPLGRRVALAARAWSGAGPVVDPPMLDLDVEDIEVVDLDASVVDIADAVADRQCPHVLVEVAESRAADVLEVLPPGLAVVRRAALAADVTLPDAVELLIDPGPPWALGASGVMDGFIEAWAALDTDPAIAMTPDVRTRLGWMSQLRLHALLEAAVAQSDLSRDRLVELAAGIDPVDFDGSTLPGLPRVGTDIGEPVGGGPLRTLRLYGRSEIGGDERGLLQVLAEDVSDLMFELRARLDAAR